MIRVFIYDPTGKHFETDKSTAILRSKKLMELLSDRDIETEIWDGIQEPQNNCFVLAHSSLLSTHQEKKLKSTESGAIVVLYTAGGELEREETKSKGHLYYLQWTSVIELLSSLPKGFNLESVDRAFKAYLKRHLVYSLAILSSCVSISSGNTSISDRQKEWQTNKKKWLEVFHDYERNDLEIALGLKSVTECPELSEVLRLLDWLWPSSDTRKNIDSPPNFSEVLVQLVENFGLTA